MGYGYGTPYSSGYGGKRDWGLVVCGALVIVLGFVVSLWPGLLLVTLSTIAGVGFLAAGIFDVVNYVRFRRLMESSGWALLNAVVNLLVGILFLLHPVVAAAVIPWMTGAFMIAFGVFTAVVAFQMRGVAAGWGLMLVNAVVGALCGVMLIIWPASFAVFVGVWLVMRGVTMIFNGLMMPRNVRSF